MLLKMLTIGLKITKKTKQNNVFDLIKYLRKKSGFLAALFPCPKYYLFIYFCTNSRTKIVNLSDYTL